MATAKFQGIPTNMCFNCESTWFNMKVSMSEGEVVAFLLDATCMNCGSAVTIATPLEYELADD